jgi:hypothetical protein
MARGIIYIELTQKGKVFKTLTGDNTTIDNNWTNINSSGALLTGEELSEAHKVDPITVNAAGNYVSGPITASWGKAPNAIDSSIDPGQCAMNVLRLASNVANTETVLIGDDTYEFSNDGAVTAGRILVDVTGDLTPSNASTKLVAAINASGTEDVYAYRISANEVLIVSKAVGAVALACSETLGGTDNAWAAATMYGGKAGGPRRHNMQSRVPLAHEVALGNMHFKFDFLPQNVIVFVAPTATPGAWKLWDGTPTITDNRVTIGNGGSVDWAATDTVYVIVTD